LKNYLKKRKSRIPQKLGLFVNLVGAHLRKFPLQSIRQPDNAKILRVGTTDYLITADEGLLTTYTSGEQGFNWADHSRADVLARGNFIIFVNLYKILKERFLFFSSFFLNNAILWRYFCKNI